MSIKLFLIFTLLVYCSARRATKIGTSRIINGDIITIDKAPYLVQLRNEEGKTFCSGTLISMEHVVTAAHCFVDRDYRHINVVAGASSLLEQGVSRSIENLHIHPEFDPLNPFGKNVAVLKLNKPLARSRNIRNTYLCSEALQAGDLLQIAGWDELDEEDLNDNSNVLSTIRMPVLSTEICKDKFGSSEGILCASDGDQDVSEIDGGGPGIFAGELCGIVSVNLEENKPAVFTNVMNVIDFSEAHIY
ncbi:seminase-like [Musca vetustissima]|uniref:seminase-like n=1 Tax=Musca vetustissima TaxID=27455 RepID=UPI002AB70808|nr:seminase-like [Musca vetustissima]